MDELLELLRKHPEGLRIGELAKAVGARSEGIRRLLEHARTTQRVRLVGHTSSRRYVLADAGHEPSTLGPLAKTLEEKVGEHPEGILARLVRKALNVEGAVFTLAMGEAILRGGVRREGRGMGIRLFPVSCPSIPGGQLRV